MKKRLRILGAFLALYLGICLVTLYGTELRSHPLQLSQNGLWLAHRFFDERDRKPVSDFELEQLGERCRRHSIKYLFVHVGPLDAAGRIPDFDLRRWRRIPGVTWLAWVGGLNADFEGQASDTVDLTKPAVRAGIAATVSQLYAAGFDGVHYDLEPIRDGDASFLALLDETPRSGILSVATPHRRPPGAPPLPPFERMWTADYYRKVAARCQQVVYMGYDSAQPSPEMYARWMRWQVGQLSGLGTQVLIGVPTYNEESTLWHNPEAETLEAALWGVSSAEPVAGVALYADWTTTEAEWDTLDRLSD